MFRRQGFPSRDHRGIPALKLPIVIRTQNELAQMVFLNLFIVNKSGGLIHHRPLSSKAPTISTNEWLRIGSTFHSLHAIAAEASPVKLPSGKNQCK
jgi:hypothetical protein